MPIGDFPGQRNWGYDGVLWYAPDHTYGSPEELKQLIDEAHSRSIMCVSRCRLQPLRPGRKLSRPLRTAVLQGVVDPMGNGDRLFGAGGESVCGRERASLVARLPLRRAAPRCGPCAGRARRARDAGRAQQGGRRARARKRPASASRSRERRQPRIDRSTPIRQFRQDDIARNGTTTTITPGMCC